MSEVGVKEKKHKKGLFDLFSRIKHTTNEEKKEKKEKKEKEKKEKEEAKEKKKGHGRNESQNLKTPPIAANPKVAGYATGSMVNLLKNMPDWRDQTRKVV
ncbi:hypothetical protein KM1_095320, partial [Entamoeba histolytica HM-3:IMSS]